MSSIISITSLVNAQEQPELDYSKAKELKLSGVEGVWLPKIMADSILSDVQLLPKLSRKIDNLESLLVLRSERLQNIKLGFELAEQRNRELTETLADTEYQLEEAEAKLNAWYRNPFVWLGVGLLVGVVVETSLIISLNN